MFNFKQFYTLNENQFRNAREGRGLRGLQHVFDLPMFSIFIQRARGMSRQSLMSNKVKSILLQAFKEARNRIGKLGFPSMHANVIITEYHPDIPATVLGDATPKGKYMRIRSDLLRKAYMTGDVDKLVQMIVHEWGHLWMFNNSKAFKKGVKDYFNMLRDFTSEVVGDEYMEGELSGLSGDRKNKAMAGITADTVDWPWAYGMTDPDELWATATQLFKRLPMQHKQKVVELINQNR